MYKKADTYSTPLILLTPTVTTVKGVARKVYPTTGSLIFASVKSYGGTEREANGIVTVEETAYVETWYRPDIKTDCRVSIEGGAVYEIITPPENVEMRNRVCKFKIRRLTGGA